MRDVATAVTPPLRPPFPYFGGKRKVASLVWSRLGDVATYNEPFFGGGAVLLGRPTEPRIETVNDLDAHLCNFWRAVTTDPDGVAFWADDPVNELDLHARHRWLVGTGRRRALRCRRDPHYFNVKAAGWWLWGASLWIGSGWCQPQEIKATATPSLLRDRGVHQRTAADARNENPSQQQKRPRTDGNTGVHADHVMDPPHKRFAGTGNGRGAGVHSLMNEKRPYLPDREGGVGVHARRWQGGGRGGGSGVHGPSLWQQKPDISGDRGASGRGVHARTVGIYEWMEALSVRLRRVRVLCGDWERALTPSVTTYIGVTGVFLDPPYDHELRERCYAEDHNISAAVRTWALAHGDEPKMRIALCGYAGEHAAHMPASWECVPWKAHGGYSRSARGVANRDEERIWFSPHCLKPADSLLAQMGDDDEG